jgi:hypothetical protein
MDTFLSETEKEKRYFSELLRRVFECIKLLCVTGLALRSDREKDVDFNNRNFLTRLEFAAELDPFLDIDLEKNRIKVLE